CPAARISRWAPRKTSRQARCPRPPGQGSKNSLATLQVCGCCAGAREPLRLKPRMAFLPCPRKNGHRTVCGGSLKTAVWQDRGRRPTRASHVRIVRTAAALGRHPCDVLIRVLDVARFAVNAVLGVDDELRIARFLHPFVDA